jgi:hemerythrin
LHDQPASFDKLRMRGNLSGVKKEPHPELVEGRTLPIPASMTSALSASVAHLGRMLRDATMHFAAEEASLERYGIKSAIVHQREHSRIMRGIHDLLVKAGASVSDDDVAEHALSIREELLSHFLKFDLKYESHILDTQGC